MLLVSLRRASKITLHLTRIKTQRIYITNRFKIININIIKSNIKIKIRINIKIKIRINILINIFIITYIIIFYLSPL